jgi:hypothetical protein
MFILQSICRGFFKVAAVAAILGHIGTVITTLLSDAALSRRASQLNMERYRSGHNGTDSKSKPFFVSLFSESLDMTGFFGVSQFHILLVLPIRSPRFPR